jgi:CRP-like cAMP-binding protein
MKKILNFIWDKIPDRNQKSDSIDQIRSFSVFSSLTKSQAALVAQHLHLRHLKPGDLFFERGQSGYALYLIIKGEAHVFYKEPSPANLIAKIKSGEFFGEVALLNPDTGRSATVVAETDVDCYALFKTDLDALCDFDPVLGATLYREISAVISQRLVMTIEHFVDLNKSKPIEHAPPT